MNFALLEVKKLLQEKMFLIFIVICLCLNIGLCFSDPDVRSAVNRMAKEETCWQGEKIYDTLDANRMGAFYYSKQHVRSSVFNRWMKEKYEKFQQAINLLDAENADLSPFAGEITPLVHRALFTKQLKVLLLECVIFISLLSLRAFSAEKQTEMAALIYSSQRGRRIAGDKILANGLVSVLFCFGLISLSLTVFFAGWNFSSLWDENIASSFHYVLDSNDPILWKPFMTWASLTLKEYFVCSLVLLAGILLVWWLLANIVSLLAPDSLWGGIVLAAALCLPFFGRILLPEQLLWLYFLDTWTLSTVIYCNQWWFTDLGIYSFFPYQEIWSVIIHLLLTAVGIGAGIRHFKRKELV